MSILIKNIDPVLQRKIRSAAAVYNMTMENFIIEILEKKLEKLPDDLGELLDEILAGGKTDATSPATSEIKFVK